MSSSRTKRKNHAILTIFDFPEVIYDIIRDYLICYPIPLIQQIDRVNGVARLQVYKLKEGNRGWMNFLSVSDDRGWKMMRKRRVIYVLNEIYTLKYLFNEEFRKLVLSKIIDPYQQLGLTLKKGYFKQIKDRTLIKELFLLSQENENYDILNRLFPFRLQHFQNSGYSNVRLHEIPGLKSIEYSTTDSYCGFPQDCADLTKLISLSSNFKPNEDKIDASKFTELSFVYTDVLDFSIFVSLKKLILNREEGLPWRPSKLPPNLSLQLPNLVELVLLKGFHPKRIKKLDLPILKRLEINLAYYGDEDSEDYHPEQTEHFFDMILMLPSLKDLTLGRYCFNHSQLRRLCTLKHSVCWLTLRNCLVDIKEKWETLPLIAFHEHYRELSFHENLWKIPTYLIFDLNSVPETICRFHVEDKGIQYCHSSTTETFFLPGGSLNYFQRFQTLSPKFLTEVSLIRLPNEINVSLQPLETVRYVRIEDCDGITDFTGLGKQKYLSLRGCKGVRDHHLPALSNVDSLNIAECFGIKSIDCLRNNRILYASNLKLKAVDLNEEDCLKVFLHGYEKFLIRVHGKIGIIHTFKEYQRVNVKKPNGSVTKINAIAVESGDW